MKTKSIVAGAVILLIACFFVSRRPDISFSSLALVAQPIGGNFTICFNAPQMSNRAHAFRKAFVDGYLTPRNPYPVFTAMLQAGISPVVADDERKLGRRGPFTFLDPNTIVNDVSRSGVCAAGAVCNSASFATELGASTSNVTVDFAPRIQVSLSNGAALTFNFGDNAQGVPIHIMNTGGTPIPLLRPNMYFNRIAIADTYLDEVISNPGTGQNDALQITAHLDLTGNCPAAPAR